ncbi:MAG: hypothetical protein K0S74_1791 [Chlamydiales bacterium]|jgi:hypothetical protein|nr:hypothetical protein [Chlamydiales bacterium]
MFNSSTSPKNDLYFFDVEKNNHKINCINNTIESLHHNLRNDAAQKIQACFRKKI